MNESLKDTLVRKLDNLPDDTARQLLDYIEFLESKYHRSVRQRGPLERLADNIEDTLSAAGLGQAAIRGTATVFDAAGNVMRGVVAAGQAVVDELQSSAKAPEAADAPDASRDDTTTGEDAARAEPDTSAGEESGEQPKEDGQTA